MSPPRSLLALSILSAACAASPPPRAEPPMLAAATSSAIFETERVAAEDAPALRDLRAPEPTAPLEPTLPQVLRHPLDADHSSPLPNGLSNPMPGGFLAGYAADTGLDIAGLHQTVYAIAAGMLDYAEGGHTLWNGRHDDPYAIRIELDEPLRHRGHLITHVWYAHLSRMDFDLPEGKSPRIHVEAGQRLGVSGIANGSPHLHLGMLLDGRVEQEWGTFLLEDDVRAVLGGFRSKTRLPRP